jgi:hypothetical protein
MDKKERQRRTDASGPGDLAKAREAFLKEAEDRKKAADPADRETKIGTEEKTASRPAQHPAGDPGIFPDMGIFFMPPELLKQYDRLMENFLYLFSAFYSFPFAPPPLLKPFSPDQEARKFFGMKTANPRKEERIIQEVASYGTQLAAIMDAVEILMDEIEVDPIEKTKKSSRDLSEKQRAKAKIVSQFKSLKKQIEQII